MFSDKKRTGIRPLSDKEQYAVVTSKKGHLGHAQGPRVLVHFTRTPCYIELRSASQVGTANMMGSFGKQVCVVCAAETHFHTTKVGIKPIEVWTLV